MIKFPILDYYLNFFHTVLVTSHMRRRRSNLVINWIQDFITSRRYSLRVNLSYSLWSWVTSGIPQVSVLGPILFLLFINDLIERCAMYSEIYLFADDAKLFKHILSVNDQEKLQDGVDELYKWTTEWLLNLNISKCKVISFGRNVDTTSTYEISDKDTDVLIERVDTIRDLGILIDEKLSFKEYSHDKINKAYRMLGLIKQNFKYLVTESFTLLSKNMVRSQLDYCSSVRSPYRKCDIEALEKVQKKATKILPQLKNLKYEDRLKSM